MPLPVILGIAAAVAGTAGLGGITYGGVKTVKAKKEMEKVKTRHENKKNYLESQNKAAAKKMDEVGRKELEIIESFEDFSSLWERIQNKPEFKELKIGGTQIEHVSAEELKKVSVGANVLLGGAGGAALGTLGGIAAAGATTAAVMAFGTASTGTAIATLSGAAATNATLAALGGGALAAGGGGIALGTTILGVSTLGVGLLIGGAIFGVTGNAISKKVDKAKQEAEKASDEMDKILAHFKEMISMGNRYLASLNKVDGVYRNHLEKLHSIVLLEGKTEWSDFTQEEKDIAQNTVLLVSLLYKMCKVPLVLPPLRTGGLRRVNTTVPPVNMEQADTLLKEISGESA